MNTENINIEDIKVGETYNVRMFVSHYSKGIISCCTVIGYDEVDGIQCGEEYDICHDEIAAFFPITPENGTKNSEPAPKYDPCRLFKDGDKVTPRLVNGRDFNSVAEDYRGKILTVTRDEEKYDNVFVEYGGDEFTIDPAYLELVTPVEELEPYYVEEEGHSWCVRKLEPSDLYSTPAWFSKKRHPNAKAAADAECARLNAEHRKEQK